MQGEGKKGGKKKKKKKGKTAERPRRLGRDMGVTPGAFITITIMRT